MSIRYSYSSTEDLNVTSVVNEAARFDLMDAYTFAIPNAVPFEQILSTSAGKVYVALYDVARTFDPVCAPNLAFDAEGSVFAEFQSDEEAEEFHEVLKVSYPQIKVIGE